MRRARSASCTAILTAYSHCLPLPLHRLFTFAAYSLPIHVSTWQRARGTEHAERQPGDARHAGVSVGQW
jgi:hypothetical protein